MYYIAPRLQRGSGGMVIWRHVKKLKSFKATDGMEYVVAKSKKEMDDWMWYKTPIAIQLDNKVWLIPMADDEGNDGGSISTTIKGLPCIPVI